MEEYKVKQIFPGEIIGKQTFTFKLEGKATIFDLKEAFTNDEGYTPEQLRMVYRTADMDVPLDDTDRLEDIDDHSGMFLVECPTMGILDGKLSLNVQDVKDVGEIAVLIGNKKCYEHFLMTRLVQDLTLPKAKLSLPWAQNTVSVVEKENRNDYIVIQYVIKNKWELIITRNDNEDDKVWKVERQTPEGQMVLLKGKRQVFQAGAPNEKNPKLND